MAKPTSNGAGRLWSSRKWPGNHDNSYRWRRDKARRKTRRDRQEDARQVVRREGVRHPSGVASGPRGGLGA